MKKNYHPSKYKQLELFENENEDDYDLIIKALYECYLIYMGMPLDEVYALKILPDRFYKNWNDEMVYNQHLRGP